MIASTGRSEEALHQYSRALELKPGFLPARLSLGGELLRLKKTDQAAGILEAGLAAGADVPALHFQLGQAYEQLGRGGDAAHEYQETMRLNPTSSDAQNALARVRASR